MITDSEDRSMIAELEQIIQAEEAKPEAERDPDLIDDCIREIAELKGVRADYSDEEINRITDKLVKATKEKMKRKRFIRLAAGIAAALVIVSGVTACAIRPTLISWILSVAKMPFGSTVEQNKITYIAQGKVQKYSNVEELLRQNGLNVYYPAVVPHEEKLIDVVVVDENNTKNVIFTFETSELEYTIHLDKHDFQRKQEAISEIKMNSLHFFVYEEGTLFVSYAEINGDEYVIQTQSINDAVLIVGGLKKVNETN